MIRSITRAIVAAGAAALLVGTLAGPAAAGAPARTPGLRVGVGNNYSGQLLVALRAVDGTVQVRRLTKNSGVFMYLDGNITGAPAVIDNGTGPNARMWVFGTVPSGAVYYRSAPYPYGSGSDSPLYGPWTSIGGGTADSPAVTCTVQGGEPWVFVRGTDGALWERSPSTAWKKIGGSITSAPSVAPASGGACPSAKDVVALGTDSAVWRWTGGAWSKIGGSSAYAPTILRRGGVTYVFVVGTNGALYVTSKDSAATSWPAFTKIGGAFTAPPAAGIEVIDGTARLAVIAEAPDGYLWRAAKAAGTADPWTLALYGL